MTQNLLITVTVQLIQWAFPMLMHAVPWSVPLNIEIGILQRPNLREQHILP